MKIDARFELHGRRLDIEREQRWHDEIDRIPFIQFKPDWKVKIIPPFADAVVRFQVELPNGCLKSIYLDSRQSLGYYGNGAYWEVYPYGSYNGMDDVGRCSIDDVPRLLEMIEGVGATHHDDEV